MEWKLRALDANGNPIEPKQEVTQEAEPQQNVEENGGIRQEEQKQEDIVQEQSEGQADVKEEVNSADSAPYELDDNSILSYLKERHNKEYDSIDVLLNNETKQQSVDLPEEVAKFYEFNKETGRPFSDYAALQQNWAEVDDTTAMHEYYKIKKPHLNRDERQYLIDDKFSYDEEATDREKKGKQIAYKEELYEARNYLEGLKEKYKAPLESSEAAIPENYKEAFSFYNKYKEENEQLSKLTEERTNQFQENTKSLFNDEFKGFEFSAGDKTFTFKPSDINKVVDTQLDVNNFYKSHLDENGAVKDLNRYHRDFFAATNADAIFKYAYEQGMADATEGIVKETKNVDMDVRTNTITDQSGTKFRVVENSDQFSFKIKKR